MANIFKQSLSWLPSWIPGSQKEKEKIRSEQASFLTGVSSQSAPSETPSTDEATKAYLKEKAERESAGGTKTSLLGGGTSIFNRKRGSSILGMSA